VSDPHAVPGAAGRRIALFVLGVGRSGTSALTRVLSLCGGTLPADLLGANPGNPLGHWEPNAALAINERILARHDSSWYDPTLRLQEPTTIGPEARAADIAEIGAFLDTLGTAPLVLIKEPRITALPELWFEAARRAGFAPVVVVAIRHPQEVIASLAARDATSPQLAAALWLKYNLLAERCSRALPRVFVEYPNFLGDWRAQLARIGSALQVDLTRRDEPAIEAFLRRDLHRQRHDGTITDPFGTDWIASLYSAFAAAARDRPLDDAILERIFAGYRGCERVVRTALDEFRARFSAVAPSTTVHVANITRLISAVAAPGSAALGGCLRSDWYRRKNPDVFAAGADPYEHWMRHGAGEGRLPCEDPLRLLDALMQERAQPVQGRSGGAVHGQD
jgi:hypothetical protein